MTKIAGSRSRSGSGSISQRHGSADPDPYQNVMDPQHPEHTGPLRHEHIQLYMLQQAMLPEIPSLQSGL
jgi:hypothetical protein